MGRQASVKAQRGRWCVCGPLITPLVVARQAIWRQAPMRSKSQASISIHRTKHLLTKRGLLQDQVEGRLGPVY